MKEKKNRVNRAIRKKVRFSPPLRPEEDSQDSKVWASEFNRLEFFRHGFALVPDPADRSPGVAFFIKGDKQVRDQRVCSCPVFGKQTCEHILMLIAFYRGFLKQFGDQTPEEAFRSSLWYRLAILLADESRETAGSMRLQFSGLNEDRILRVVDADGKERLQYFSQSSDIIRFIERMDPADGKAPVPTRMALLTELAALTLTDEEQYMAQMGFKSRRQVFEESFYYRLAYHSFREFDGRKATFHPAIEESAGEFTVTLKQDGESSIWRLVVPRKKVKDLLLTFREIFPDQREMAIHPIPLKSVLRISAKASMNLEIKPLVQVTEEGGKTRTFAREGLERFRYGDLFYVKELGLLAQIESPGRIEANFPTLTKTVIRKAEVPRFLQDFGQYLQEGPHIVDATVKNLRIYSRFDRVEITPAVLKRDWCWLSARYGFGNSSISLAQVLQAKKEGRRFVSLADGWVDCEAEDFDSLTPLLNRVGPGLKKGLHERMKLSRMDLLRLKASTSGELEVAGKSKAAAIVKSMLELRPPQPLPEPKGLTSALRPYQRLGVEWLYFLFENGLGGLLCDDMGMGKTHEAMAFMLSLQEGGAVDQPFLVVCPTTVLSHWQQKISIHAPVLKAAVFHGGQRDLEKALREGHVLLTSYGILRNDIDQLRRISFSAAVFDEIQNLKNPQTQSYEAAEKLRAAVKIGLTGTPIENNLAELKALIDLTVPGYLGTHEEFHSRYVQPIERDPAGKRRVTLSRLISPFTLRRMKKTVLTELPEKIEDIRTCSLSDDQIKLYREAIASRGKGLVDTLNRGKAPIPYIHIFALLTLLKQVCDHPALVEGKEADFERYQSGKWELFKELVSESLDSGQKVVIYSQFLGMIRIIEAYLRGLGADFVSLTGASRNREEIISRFNEDPKCRLYVGSLKAGGAGIDLIAASVVIHYDRWWNAAKEDQATDRVHRIGQRRGVQVFKLVTVGTLEEKISALIEKKKNLMDQIIREDDPGLLKSFSREELLALLSDPS
jgi:superfamily II DNA or RNA helicase